MKNKYAHYKKKSKYQFCEIPNTDEGRELVRLMRKYLNKDVYNMRVKGHLLDSDKYDWRHFTYGSPIYASKALRIYIDGKR
tara:strand:- start:1718 stop:1960 length:243 start_codon:yes stop_codon:yes gene_type:complete